MANDKMTRKGVIEEYEFAPRTFDYLVATKQIPYSRLGKRIIRFSRKRLDEWFKEREAIEYHRPAKKVNERD